MLNARQGMPAHAPARRTEDLGLAVRSSCLSDAPGPGPAGCGAFAGARLTLEPARA